MSDRHNRTGESGGERAERELDPKNRHQGSDQERHQGPDELGRDQEMGDSRQTEIAKEQGRA